MKNEASLATDSKMLSLEIEKKKKKLEVAGRGREAKPHLHAESETNLVFPFLFFPPRGGKYLRIFPEFPNSD